MRNPYRLFALLALTALPLPVARAEDLSAGLGPEQLREIEDAVDRGLRWLSTQQNADGTFRGYSRNSEELGSRTFLTSFAALAFMSRGHQPDQGRYGPVLSKAIDWLVSIQRTDGSFSERPPDELPFLHAHAVSGVALSEAYSFTSASQMERVGDAIRRALDYSRRMQKAPKLYPEYENGWYYASKRGPDRSNLSCVYVTCWELTFLRSAENAGFDVPQAWVDEGLEFIERCYRPGPGVVGDRNIKVKRGQGYFQMWPRQPPDMPVWANFKTTAGGMLPLQYHGRRDDPRVRKAADWIVEHPIPTQGSLPSVYHTWYLSSQALAQVGGEHWKDYYPRFVGTLMPHQAPDGHWRLDRSIGWGNETKLGPAYYTAVAVICLTLPDQLLPIHQR